LGGYRGTPGYDLDVNGDINFTGTFYQGGSPFVSSLWTSGNDSLYYTASNVGIGTDTAEYTLDVHGNANVGALTTTSVSGDGSALYGIQSSNVSDFASNVTRIGTLETDLGSNATRIGTLETDLGSNATRIGTLETDLGSNATRIGTLETDLGSNVTRIGTLETDLGSNVTRIGTLETDLGSNVTRIGTLETDLSDNSSRIGVLETDLSDNSSRIGVLETDLGSNVTRIGTLETDLSDNSSRIGVLETDLSDNSSRIGVLETDLGSNVTRIGTLETDLSDNSSRIGVLETDLSDNSSRIGVLETDLSDNSSRIGVLETDLSDNSSRITSIESGAHTFTGIKTFEDDVILESNLRVNGDLLVANTVHMIVSDPIMELGANNLNTGDLGIIMTRHGETGNVAIVYDESQDVLNVGYTLSNAYENAITMDTANSLTLQVNGALNVGSNVVIDDTASNVIEVSGNVKTDSLFLGNFEVVASQGLSHVTAVSAATNDTVYLNNPTTGLVVGSNVEVGGNLSVDSNVEVGGNLSVEGDLEFNGNLTMNTITVQTLFTLDHVVSQGNTTSNTVQFTNPTTALTATGNVEVGGELSVSANVELSSDLTVSGNVGVGTTEPTETLDIVGNLNLQKVSNTASIKLNSNVVTEFVRSKKLIRYPRIALPYDAQSSQGGYENYIVDQSSVYTSESGEGAYAAFRDVIGNHWLSSSNSFDGAPDVFNGVNGPWISIQLPDAIKLEYLEFYQRNSFTNQKVTAGSVYASNDGTNWTEIGTLNNVGDYTTAVPARVNFTHTTLYDRYLLHVTANQTNYVSMERLSFYGVPEYDPEADGTDVIMRSVPNVPNTDLLEVYWDAGNTSSYSGSGTTVTDLSGNDVTGTIYGTNGFDSTYNAWEFDGSGDYIQGTATIGMVGTGQVIHTWSLWVKNLTPTSTQYAYICGFGSASSANMSGFMLRNGDQLEFTILGTYVYVKEPFPYRENTWKHIVGVYRGNAWNASNCDVYIDGRKATLVGTATQALNISGTAINIGSSPGGGQPFVGSIANARVFSRALNADEVWELYAHQREYFGHGNLDMTLKSGVLGVQGNITVNNYPFSSAAVLQVSTNQTQSLNSSYYQTVTFNNVDVDTINGWDTTFNRYKPSVPGYYLVNAQRFAVNTTSSFVVCLIRKNEVDVCSSTIVGSGINYPMGGATALVYLNGTTDYIYVLGVASSTLNITTSRSLHIIHVSF
jgi:hypothetical protein